jgi:eukaryotic-like serine/threonine-protein kinase
MTPARFQTIEEIFLAALEQEPDQVGVFLDKACEGDEALRREVEVLLASDHRAGWFIERSTVGLATKIIENRQATLLIGQTIGHYKISKLISTGGMGEVYLATDIVAGRKAALKLLPMRFTGDAERLKRFQQEAHAVVALNHPNILTVYEIGEDHSIHYIASELIEGETVRERLTRGAMQLSVGVDIAIQMASALAVAHEAGIVHRDIKPDNIMLRPDGYVKVLDFGIAKLAEQEVPATIPTDEALSLVETNLGSILGTAHYMSPEQAYGAPVDKSTDIWSLGVVVYEMVTGHVPFNGDTPREVMSSILEREPQPLTTYVANAPAELQQIINSTLRKNREERYHSARELLEALKGLRHKLEVEAELQPSTATPSWLRWTRSPTALVLGLLVAAIAVAVPFYWHRNLTTTSPPEKSIAVLPFVDLSEIKDQEYFCDGMSEEIINALAKVEGLRVVSRTSSFSFKGEKTDVSEIGKKLNVENVLEGSLRREGNRIRVNAELINTRNGFHLWTETYDRELAGVFVVQDEITRAIVDALKVKLAVSLPAHQQPNAGVYDLYLQGIYFSNKSSEEDLRRALSFFQRAVEKDPTFARAWTGIAKGWYLLADVYVKPLEAYPLSREAAMKAIALDERDAEAHCYLSEAKRVLDWDLAGADAELTRALELDPNSAPAHLFSGLHPLFRGELKDGLRGSEIRSGVAYHELCCHRRLSGE